MGYRLKCYDVVDSTNDLAKQLARNGEFDVAVMAEQQTKGRGRSGNDWISPKGNLYLSLIVADKVALKDAGQLSFVTAVALYNTLKKHTDSKLEQKWPNDLLLNGKKVSGILLESEAAGQNAQWIVIGLGVNIQNAPENASRLEGEVSPQKLAQLFLIEFSNVLDLWRKSGFDQVRGMWVENAKGIGQNISVRLPRETKVGVFKDIDETGCLILNQQGKDIKIASGDVFFSQV